jgi:threonine aldolase
MTAKQQDEQRAILRRCERSLSGHGFQTARQTLEQLIAEVGPDEWPDRYGEGDLIEGLEREIAEILGKEAALFLPSGTMAQQIALRMWSDRRGSRTVGFHPTCHLETHEEKGYQTLHGLHGRLIGDPHRLLTLDDLQKVAEPMAALLLELPQREIGGQLPSWEDLQAQTGWARERGTALHMDGARLWEAAPFYERTYAEIARLFDSVYVSFYKGLGAIAGAALAGPAGFIAEARVWQRRHGGTLISLFPLLISARASLHRRLDRFPAYYRRAAAIGRILSEIPGIEIKPNPPQSNMMHVYLQGKRDRLMEAALDIARENRVALFRWLTESEVPGYCMFELSIGDAAFALSDEEIDVSFRRIMMVEPVAAS